MTYCVMSIKTEATLRNIRHVSDGGEHINVVWDLFILRTKIRSGSYMDKKVSFGTFLSQSTALTVDIRHCLLQISH